MTQHSQSQTGYMLLEILITVGILGVGLLGVSAMQVSALKTSQSAVLRGEAAIRIAEMSNRMRANLAGVASGDYNKSSAYFSEEACTSSSGSLGRACDDIKTWLAEVQLSHGANTNVRIDCAGRLQTCVLGIQWDDHRGNPDVNTTTIDDSAENYTYETNVVF